MVKPPKRGEVFLVNLDPTVGSEIRKTRPGLVVSPDEANAFLNTVIIAPLTTTLKPYPTRVELSFQGKHGSVALDQLRAVDKSRLAKRVGMLEKGSLDKVLGVLGEMFAE